jgi:hypothetical protein
MDNYNSLDTESMDGYLKYIYSDLGRIPDAEWSDMMEKLESIRHQISEKDESTIRLIINKYTY